MLKSIKIISICLLLYAHSLANGNRRMSQSKYEDKADSIRKERLNPRNGDSIHKSQHDNMPVIKNTTGDSTTPMPKAEPEKNQRMPVKELSDTTYKK